MTRPLSRPSVSGDSGVSRVLRHLGLWILVSHTRRFRWDDRVFWRSSAERADWA